MTMLRHMITGFMAGEIDPLLGGRVDTDPYTYGLETCENFVPLNEGPLVKRQGFRYVGPAPDGTAWLSAFRRDIDQEYVVAWGEGVARLYTDGAQLSGNAGDAVVVSHPYTAAQAPLLSFQQSYDRLYIDHPSHPPAAIRRDGPDAFAYEVTKLVDGPFADANTDEARKVSVTGALTVGGAITINASAPIFADGHAGSPFRIEAKDFSELLAWEPGMKDVPIGEVVRSDGKAYKALTAGTTGSVQPTHSSGTAWDGLNKSDLLNDKGPYGVRWEYLYDKFGIVDLTAVASATQATGTVRRRVPSGIGTVPTHRWALAAFSAEAGWPSHVALWSGRLVHLKDIEIVASVVGDYGGGQTNFATHSDSGTLTDDLAFRRAIATEDTPLWVAADRSLIVGTASRELSIDRVNTSGPLSGQNISARPQSFYGSERVAPAQVGTETIFVERGGKRLRASDYDLGRDRYVAADLTATARHITGGGIVQLAYQRVPHALVYALRDDGQLALHPKSRSEVKGFSRIKLGGGARALSAVAITGADAKSDDLWLLVERETPTGAVREIWMQSPWRELGDDYRAAFYVDGGVTVQATGGETRFDGFQHLAGQPVAVLANGGVVPNIMVDSGGRIELPAQSVPATDFTLTVGLPYTATAATLRLEVRGGRNGPMQGVRQNIKSVVTRLLDSVGVRLGAAGSDETETLVERAGNDAMDAPIPLFSGDKAGQIAAEFDYAGRLKWISEDPLPAVIVAGMTNIEVDTDDVR